LKRAKKLEREIALNYRDTLEKRATTGRAPTTRGERVPLREGMTLEEVYQIEGAPLKETVWGSDTLWNYPDKTVIFSNGRLKKVRLEKEDH
jgi:hypothetical protein